MRTLYRRCVWVGVAAGIAALAVQSRKVTWADRKKRDASASWARVACPAGPILAGQTLVIEVQSKSKKPLQWQFGYEKQRMAAGKVNLDGAGRAKVSVAVPSVRHRTVFSFLLLGGGDAIRRSVMVYPAAVLARAVRKIADFEIWVVDPTERVEQALRAEKVDCRVLTSMLQKDSFTGGMVILAGHEKAADLTDLCERFKGRVRKGMWLLILNPPPDWTGWELEPAALPTLADWSKTFCLEKRLEAFIPPEDWAAADVRFKVNWKTPPGLKHEKLIWLETIEKEKEKKEKKTVIYPLVVEQKIGEGVVLVATLPNLSHPDTDALGRRILCGFILRAIPVKGSLTNREKQS